MIKPNTQTASLQFAFQNTQNVQVVIINNNPYFVAVDVCEILGLQNPTARLKEHLDSDEYLTYEIRRSGQKRSLNVISESGLYALIFQSRKPGAKAFRKWVTSEVLPAIRKTGKFETQTAPTAPSDACLHRNYVKMEEYRVITALVKASESVAYFSRLATDYMELCHKRELESPGPVKQLRTVAAKLENMV